jgi:hypothetical protein
MYFAQFAMHQPGALGPILNSKVKLASGRRVAMTGDDGNN